MTESTTIAASELFQFSAQEVINNFPHGLVVINTSGNIAWINAAAEKLLAKNLNGKNWSEVINEYFNPREDDGYEISLKNGRRVHIAISSLTNPPGELVVITDFTLIHDFEQARESQKQLLALGRMTAQLAHQIRTPLSSAMLYSEHLSGLAITEPRFHQWLSRIKTCHVSIEQQIRDLLLFARGEHIEKYSIELKLWGEKLTERILNTTDERKIKIRIVNQLSNETVKIHGEALIGALMNLVNNAIEADATVIEMSMTEHSTLNKFQIIVQDNGHGMEQDVQAKALSPFFTTRAQGTGLGLAVVNAVINAHKGNLNIDSKKDMGTTITIDIPMF